MDALATGAVAMDRGAASPREQDRSGLSRFNALPPDDAAAELAACCASRRWVGALSLSRPFTSVDALYSAAAEHLAALDWPDVREALAAHPRIGERAAGTGREAAWSRAEQSGAQDATARTAADLAAANAVYEAKFGYVFLIRAAGRSAEQMLTVALDRLDHDELTEQAVVRDELGQIVRLRLDKLLAGLAEGTGPSS
jgi:2-oxo-4-hydroxy-4-carboxy-5-ureidoimidazoline decarboxylase